MVVAQSVVELVGSTPVVKLNYFSRLYEANIFAKCEFMNPNGSIKDRVTSSSVIEVNERIQRGELSRDVTLISATSGNAGVGLASACAVYGIRLIVVMPSCMSIERQRLISAFGAKIELTPSEKGMSGAVERASELERQLPNSMVVDHFKRSLDAEVHRRTTAKEILDTFGEDSIDVFIAGVGSGSSLSGIGEVIKGRNPEATICALEPASSSILSGGKGGSHKIQGIGVGFVPDNLNRDVYDRVLTVSDDEATQTSRLLAQKEGLIVGISSGANVFGACMLAREHKGKNILTILCDTGERYLSTGLFKI